MAIVNVRLVPICSKNCPKTAEYEEIIVLPEIAHCKCKACAKLLQRCAFEEQRKADNFNIFKSKLRGFPRIQVGCNDVCTKASCKLQHKPFPASYFVKKIVENGNFHAINLQRTLKIILAIVILV